MNINKYFNNMMDKITEINIKIESQRIIKK